LVLLVLSRNCLELLKTMKKLIIHKQKTKIRNMSKIKLSDHFEYGPSVTTSYQEKPECDILVNKQKRKTYGKKKNKVYLNDGDNIQLHLFNPLYHRIGVQLEFNGELEEKMLIINPGQKVLLDRFVDTKKKIKFGTYFIDGNDKSVKDAIKKNGNMKIHFWSEKIKPMIYSGVEGLRGNVDNIGNFGGGLPHFTNTNLSTNLWEPTYYNSSIKCSGDLTNFNSNSISNYSDEIQPKLKETGRIEKGKKSNQKMKEIDFEPDKIFYVKDFKLLPFSKLKDKKKKTSLTTKPKSISVDIHNSYYRSTDHRIYCSNPLCGYRVRNRSWKFCPICSTELD